MEDTKDYSHTEHFEEGEEDKGGGEGEEEDGQQGGDASIEDCGTQGEERGLHPLQWRAWPEARWWESANMEFARYKYKERQCRLSLTLGHFESVGHVYGVVDG